MNRTTAILLGIAALILIGVGAAYAFLVSPTKGPSQPAATTTQETATPRPSPPPLTEPSTPNSETVVVSEGQTRYRIVSASSSATFELDEVLRGAPKTVVGTSTGYVMGEIAVDRNNLASSTIGTVRINARTFVTDAEQRNNAIRRLILKTETDENEFITFKPSSIIEVRTEGDDALPGAVYDITGDLTIAGMTKPVTFRVETLLEAEVLTLHAFTTVNRSNFDLVIPNIPFVANVEDEVELELDIVAKPVSE